MTESCYYIWLIAVAIGAFMSSALAQETNSSVADSDRDALVRVTRIMRKIDKDGNGTFEKSEDDAAWRRYRKLDANKDEVISMEVLRKERIAYLESGGQRKLNLVCTDTRRYRNRQSIWTRFESLSDSSAEIQHVRAMQSAFNSPLAGRSCVFTGNSRRSQRSRSQF